ncbi:uncharacterized protein LOC116194519 [Punica granatum]|uniref:Uncharacterized protein n=2 Tax=Punica granatum TaxID=22663 RepID=A0A218WH02_PUNGR|nr:uncharacterized protein LOC116194519 [Punica granatum]OWM71491.1 hypothetical protein CDL15_Pgr005678 [Punica granatum]PKI79134.1 hypothetical protein CRG98_000426 [Punica granatum]
MAAMFRYQKLKPEAGLDVGADTDEPHYPIKFRSIPQRSSSRIWARVRRVHVRRRVRLRVPGLRRFLRWKARLVAAAVRKVVRRLKEGQGHWGDLFAGNYLFLQVNPSSPAMKKCAVDRSNNPSSRFSATYSPPRSVA